jgi:hypothetical protein
MQIGNISKKYICLSLIREQMQLRTNLNYQHPSSLCVYVYAFNLLHIQFILGRAKLIIPIKKQCNNLHQKYILTDKVTIDL